MPRPPAPGPQRLPGLTGLRAVAALSVVVGHFGQHLSPARARPFFANATYLVDVFFVLSGFLLGFAYTDAKGLSVSRGRFLLGRTARLYPAYAVAMVLSLPRFLELLPEGGRGATGAAKAAAIALLTLTMTQSWVPNAQSWNGPAWSLSCEAFFYVTFAFAARPLLRVRPAVRWSSVIGLCLLSAVISTALSHHGHPHAFMRLPILRVGPFLLAALVGADFRERPIRTPGPAAVTAAQLSIAACLAALVATMANDLGWGHLAASVVGLLMVVSLAADGRGGVARVLDSCPGRLLGDASYGIYIYHVGVFWLAARLAGAERLSINGFAATILALAALSVASVKLFEVPARHALFRLAGYRRRPPQTAKLPDSGEDSSAPPATSDHPTARYPTSEVPLI